MIPSFLLWWSVWECVSLFNAITLTSQPPQCFSNSNLLSCPANFMENLNWSAKDSRPNTHNHYCIKMHPVCVIHLQDLEFRILKPIEVIRHDSEEREYKFVNIAKYSKPTIFNRVQSTQFIVFLGSWKFWILNLTWVDSNDLKSTWTDLQVKPSLAFDSTRLDSSRLQTRLQVGPSLKSRQHYTQSWKLQVLTC
jgi:hypothetical protein